VPERTNGTDLKSVGGLKSPSWVQIPPSPPNGNLGRIKISQLFVYIFYFLLFTFYPDYTSRIYADYPDVFPFHTISDLGFRYKKDTIVPLIGLNFSFWSKNIFVSEPKLTDGSAITLPKYLNWSLSQLAKSSNSKISIRDTDFFFSGDYAFSESFFANFGFFVRFRDFGGLVNSFGLGDINVNFGFKLLSKPLEIFSSGGAVIPLAGEPDENLAFLRRINVSSFGVDFPFYLFLRQNFDSSSFNFSPFISGGYILRVGYIFFSQNIVPGDVLVLSSGFGLKLKNFLPTNTDLSHDINIFPALIFLHGFPDLQDSGIYRITGKSWDVVKFKFSPSLIFKKSEEKFGERFIRDFAFIQLSLYFTIYEKNFLYVGDPNYSVWRAPFLDRVSPGFTSTLSAGLLF
jgi:hypothetical protein